MSLVELTMLLFIMVNVIRLSSIWVWPCSVWEVVISIMEFLNRRIFGIRRLGVCTYAYVGSSEWKPNALRI